MASMQQLEPSARSTYQIEVLSHASNRSVALSKHQHGACGEGKWEHRRCVLANVRRWKTAIIIAQAERVDAC